MELVGTFERLSAAYPLLTLAAVAVAKFGLALPGLALFWGLRRRAHVRALWPLIAGALLAVALTLIGGHVVHDERPFVALHVAPLIEHVPDNGFPSDHCVAAAYIAGLLWFFDAGAAFVATLGAVLLGLARIFCLVHWPIDVAGGFAIGALPAIPAAWLSHHHYGEERSAQRSRLH